MKQITALRYSGNNHVSLIANKKNNKALFSTVHSTSLSSEEAEEQLKADLSLQVEGEFELTLVDVPTKKLTSLTTEKLLKYYEKTSNLLGAKEMIEAILIKRRAISIAEPEEEETESPEPVEGEDKPVKEYKKCMTEECLQARLAEARLNYKKFCKFLCTKDKEEHFGIIRSARLDKRSGFIQYRIEILEAVDGGYDKTGRVYGKGDDSKDLTIFEEDTKPADLYLLSEREVPAQAEETDETEENTNEVEA